MPCMSPPITQAPRGLTRSTGLLDHIQAPLPPADTTRSPVECDQEVRLNNMAVEAMRQKKNLQKNSWMKKKLTTATAGDFFEIDDRHGLRGTLRRRRRRRRRFASCTKTRSTVFCALAAHPYGLDLTTVAYHRPRLSRRQD